MWSWILVSVLAATPGDVWPAFRGDGSSQSAAVQLPLQWSDTEQVAWSIDLPGYGQSSPVVWKNLVFVTSTEGEDKDRLLVTAWNATDGKQVWSKEFAASQKVKASDYVSRGAPTPVVDAERLYVFFESGDLLALTHAGEVVWQRSLVKDYGEFQGNHGVGASIAASPDAVVVLIDHSGPSYLLAVDKATGKNRWKVDRPSKTSWSSPVVRQRGELIDVLISSNGSVDCYNAVDGTRRWWVQGLDGNTVASPSVSSDLVIVGSSKVNQNIAIRADGTGDVTESGIRWRSATATSSFGSPLIVEDMAYFVNRAGVLFAVELATGEVVWNERLPDSCWASPIFADGRIYCFTTKGNCVVLKPGREVQKLAENTITSDDRVYGVAAVDRAFFVRSGSKLWRIGTPTVAPQ